MEVNVGVVPETLKVAAELVPAGVVTVTLREPIAALEAIVSVAVI
jgi:hypothetical protein